MREWPPGPMFFLCQWHVCVFWGRSKTARDLGLVFGMILNAYVNKYVCIYLNIYIYILGHVFGGGPEIYESFRIYISNFIYIYIYNYVVKSLCIFAVEQRPLSSRIWRCQILP